MSVALKLSSCHDPISNGENVKLTHACSCNFLCSHNYWEVGHYYIVSTPIYLLCGLEQICQDCKTADICKSLALLTAGSYTIS